MSKGIKLNADMFLTTNVLVRVKEGYNTYNDLVGDGVYRVLDVDFETERLLVSVGKTSEWCDWEVFMSFEPKAGHNVKEVEIPIVPEYVANYYEVVKYNLGIEDISDIEDTIIREWLNDSNENVKKLMLMIDYGDYQVEEKAKWTVEYIDNTDGYNSYNVLKITNHMEFTITQLCDMGIILDRDTMELFNDNWRVHDGFTEFCNVM